MSLHIKHLSHYSPAQLNYILNRRMDADEMLGHLFVHQLLKRRLRALKVIRQGKYNNNTYEAKYIIPGKHDLMDKPWSHESFLLRPFYGERKQLQFRQMLKIGYEASAQNFKSDVLRELKKENIHKRNLLFYLFKIFRLNEKGKLLRAEIEKEIAGIEKTLRSLLKDDRAQAVKIVQSVGANVFLSHKISFTQISELQEEFKNKNRTIGDSTGAYEWCNYEEIFRSFEFNPGESSGGSDCSSGCGSGCSSGCGGGCGGCGGGD